MDGGNSGGSRIKIRRVADCNVKLYFYSTYASFASFFFKIHPAPLFWILR